MYKIYKSVSVESQPFRVESAFAVATLNETIELSEENESTLSEPVDPLEVYRIEGENILSQARQKAEQLLQQQRQELEELTEQVRQQAYDEGVKQGRDEGLKSGYEAGLNQAEQEMKETVAGAAQKAEFMLGLSADECRSMLKDNEREMVELALAIAKKILAREIENNPMTILPIAREALAKVKDQEEVTIRVHPNDFDLMLQARTDLQLMVGRDKPVLIAADEAMPQGSCAVDTSCGTVDARIDNQFENVKKALLEVMPS